MSAVASSDYQAIRTDGKRLGLPSSCVGNSSSAPMVGKDANLDHYHGGQQDESSQARAGCRPFDAPTHANGMRTSCSWRHSFETVGIIPRVAHDRNATLRSIPSTFQTRAILSSLNDKRPGTPPRTASHCWIPPKHAIARLASAHTTPRGASMLFAWKHETNDFRGAPQMAGYTATPFAPPASMMLPLRRMAKESNNPQLAAQTPALFLVCRRTSLA